MLNADRTNQKNASVNENVKDILVYYNQMQNTYISPPTKVMQKHKMLWWCPNRHFECPKYNSTGPFYYDVV